MSLSDIVLENKFSDNIAEEISGNKYILEKNYLFINYVKLTFEGDKGVFEFDSEVTRIEEIAFFNHSYITSIDLPNTISYIGNSAFYGCKKLKNITIKTKKF